MSYHSFCGWRSLFQKVAKAKGSYLKSIILMNERWNTDYLQLKGYRPRSIDKMMGQAKEHENQRDYYHHYRNQRQGHWAKTPLTTMFFV